MREAVTFVGGIVGVEAAAFVIVNGTWRLGLWKLNRNIRKREQAANGS